MILDRTACVLALGTILAITSGCKDGTDSSGGSTVRDSDPVSVGGTVIERGTDCSTCSISVVEQSILGRVDDPYAIGDGSFLVELPDGRCIVGPTDRERELLAFEECSGPPASFGVPGEGPGELGSIRAITGWRGDSVLAFGYGRLTILSGESGAGRTQRFDPSTEGTTVLAVAADSALIVNSDHPTKPQFTAIESNGTTGASFGLGAPMDTDSDPTYSRAVLGSSRRTGALWTVSTFHRFEVQEWSSAGLPLRHFTPAVRWFGPYDATALKTFWAGGSAVHRPLPFARAIHEDQNGVLWVAHAVAAADWKPDSVLPNQRRGSGGEARRGSSSRAEHYDGALTALDADSGRLLVTIQLADVPIGFANDSTAYARRTHADGVQQIALLRFRLAR